MTHIPLPGLVIGLALASLFTALYMIYRPPKWIFSGLAKRSPLLFYFAHTDQRLMALTIDDGPDPETTQKILEVLKKYQTPATFFLISSRVTGHEDIVRKIISGGHEIGNHLMDEAPSALLTPAAFARALERSHQTLSAYAEIRWFRPGSGWINPRMLAEIRKYGYRCALGSVYPYDGQVASAKFSRHFIQANAFPGAVLVLHDRGSRGLRTAAILEEILPDFQASGWRFTTLSGLIEESTQGKRTRSTDRQERTA